MPLTADPSFSVPLRSSSSLSVPSPFLSFTRFRSVPFIHRASRSHRRPSYLPPSPTPLRALSLASSNEWLRLTSGSGRAAAAGNSRLHPEITELGLPALERFLNKIPFFLSFLPALVPASQGSTGSFVRSRYEF